MTHRNRIEQAKVEPFNNWMKRFFIGLTVFGIVVFGIIQVIAHADEIDSNGRMAFNVLGVMFLSACGVIWFVKRVTGRI